MKIAFLGDLGFFGNMNLDNNDSLLEYFKPMNEHLQGFDLVVANLETPIIDAAFKTYGKKSAYISTSASSIELLKYLNISVVSLANNHTYDYGRTGLNYTKKILTENNINYFGIDGKDYIYQSKNQTIAFHGYCCYSTNSYGLSTVSHGKGIHSLEYTSLSEKLNEYEEKGFTNIICPHFGEEHVNIPNVHHINFFRKLSKKNNFIMVGHHPHVIQGIEKLNNCILAYSLGNFCFDDVYIDIQKEPLVRLTENNRTSMVFSLKWVDDQIEYKTRHFYFGETVKFLRENPVFIEACKILKQDLGTIGLKRRDLLNNYLQTRKAKRDYSWYLKRFKLKYIIMILRAKYNSKMFHKNVINPLK